MTRIKRSKFPIVAFICVIAAITFLCLLFPVKITGAEGSGDSLEISRVTYHEMMGFSIETDDYDASDVSGVKTSCISVYYKNKKKLKIDSERILDGTLYFSVSGLSATPIDDVKIVFEKGFCVSSGGPVLASEIVFKSGSTDSETGIVLFKAVEVEKSEQSVSEGSKNESVGGGSETTESSGRSEETSAESETSVDSDTSVDGESPSEEQSETEITSDVQTDSGETGSEESVESDSQGENFSGSEDIPTSDEPSITDILYESDNGETSVSGESDESNEAEESNESDESVFESGNESGEQSGESDNESEVVRPPFNIGENKGANQDESGNDSDESIVPIEEIEVENDVYELKIGEEATVALTVLPENATEEYSVTFTSEGIAEYESFTLKGIAAGETELVLKAENVEKRIKITVLSGKTEDSDKTEEIIYCEKISVPKSMKILLFGTEKLEVKTIPENVNFGKPGFASDNEEIATVDENGNVTAIFRGKCNITVSFPTSDGGIIEEVVEVDVYDEIVDITRDTDIVLTIKDDKIIAGDLEFTFTYKSGLVIKKTIQNAMLSYRKDENGKFIGTISFVEDGKNYSFDIPASLNVSGCGDGCGSAIVGNHGLLTGYIVASVLSAVFIFINRKTR